MKSLIPTPLAIDNFLIREKRITDTKEFIKDKSLTFNKKYPFSIAITLSITIFLILLTIWSSTLLYYVISPDHVNNTLYNSLAMTIGLLIIAYPIYLFIKNNRYRKIYTLDLEKKTLTINSKEIPLSEITEARVLHSGMENGYGWLLFLGTKEDKILLSLGGLWELIIAKETELAAWIAALPHTGITTNSEETEVRKGNRYGLPLTQDRVLKILQSCLFNEVNRKQKVR